MNGNVFALFGICSAVVNIAGVIPYIHGIFKGKTKPERSSWWIWTLIMAAVLSAQVSVGVNWSLLLTGSFLLCNAMIASLSLKYGYGRFKTYDLMAILLAVAGIIIWRQTGRPILALLILIIIDFGGNVLTMEKTWRAPYTENFINWVCGAVASVFGLLAVGSLDPKKLIFPVYAVFVTFLMVGLLDYRRRWRSQRIKAGLAQRSK